MYASGKNVAKIVLDNDITIKKAYISVNFKDDFIISALEKQKIPIKYVDKTYLNNLVQKNHQGIILDIEAYQYASLDDLLATEDNFLVILDHIVDPQNLGAIIRSCEGFGVDGVIIPKDRSAVINDTVIRASAGAVFNVKIAREINLSQTINLLKQAKYWIIGADLSGEQLGNISLSGNRALVIGSEGFGLSKMIAKRCDFFATIPMYGRINSLNASVAGAILIYEIQKRRRK